MVGSVLALFFIVAQVAAATDEHARSTRCSSLLEHAQSTQPPQVLRGQPRRAALLLRGVGFRNQDEQHNKASCCNGSEFAQRVIADRHHKFLIPQLEAHTGGHVDVFISTYRCSNGHPWTYLLSKWYASRLVNLHEVELGESGAHATTMRGYAAIGAFELMMEIEYDFVMSVRLDSMVVFPMPSCLLSPLRPLDGQGIGIGNMDNFQLLPRGYFQCMAQHAAHCTFRGACTLYTAHPGVNNIMKECGETPNASHAIAFCKFDLHKHTGRQYWRALPRPNRISTAEPHGAGCTCDAGLAIHSDNSPRHPPSITRLAEKLQSLAVHGELPIDGCTVIFNRSVVAAKATFSNGSVVGRVKVLPMVIFNRSELSQRKPPSRMVLL